MTLPYFVYGTLKPCGRYWPQIENYVVDHEPALLDGYDLYALQAGYPAIIAGSSRVSGILLHFSGSRRAEAIEIMNRIEGYSPGSDGCLYVPHEVVVSNSGSKTPAITYVWGTGSRSDLETLGELRPSGAW